MLERLDFAVFLDLVWMTASVGPIFTFSEQTCSRDDGVSLGIGSCHPTEFSAIVHICRSSFDGM